MDKKYIDSVSRIVYKQFPEVSGVRPKVSKQKTLAKSLSFPKTFLFTFHTKAKTPTNIPLTRVIRVVTDENGKIIKVSTSR